MNTTGCVSISDITSPYSPSEERLISIARKVRALAHEATGEFGSLDARADALLEDARKVWAQSPRRSRSTSDISAQDGYEIAIVYRALTDYYAATGRPALAIPLLEGAAVESRALRYYGPWEELSLELVALYQRLGLIDHARDHILGLLRFLERIGITLDAPPDRLNMDTVVFLTLHATQLEIRPDAYQDAETLQRLYRLLLRSADASPESWGWDPSSGYRYVSLFTPFAIRLAELGELEAAREIRMDVVRIHRRNRTLDPFVIANEKKLDWVQTPLGRDLHRLVDFPFAVTVAPFNIRLGDRPPTDRRYLASGAFRENFELARIDLALSNPRSALEVADLASESVVPLRAFYTNLDAALTTKDGVEHEIRALNRTRAAILEALGRFAEAEHLYEDYISWSERERSSLPVEQRVHFFRGQARSAYQGSIRCSIALYEAAHGADALDLVVAKAERLRARGFQDLLGLTTDRRDVPTIASLLNAIDEETGIIQFLDLDTRVAVILVTRERALVHSIEKPADWESEIFRLRNRLARNANYDTASFARLGNTILAFAVSELSRLDRLIVTSEGALSALPLGILPPAPGQMLQDQIRITLVPSLSLWLANKSDATPRKAQTPRAFILGDPAFAEPSVIERSIGKERLALRGSDSLAYFQRLPETAGEARSVLQAFPAASQSKLLLGTDATESRIKANPDLARYSHLHFATHGVIANDLPNLSEPALVLAWEEHEDGFLTAREVTELDLDAQLTVLSACNTGNGEYFAGEGLMGMGRAFMEAGSRRVIVSLWPVESFSTQRMMELFYAHLARGESETEALWLAQRDLRATLAADVARGSSERGISVRTEPSGVGNSVDRPFENPFYWSPFVLISSE